MRPAHYQSGTLHIEDVPLPAIAEAYGTPTFVYSAAAITRAYQNYTEAFVNCDHAICYAVKANSNLAILGLLARLGAGFDIVSGGELHRVIVAGGDPAKTIFSGVGKQDWEIELALSHGIACFNIESSSELQRIERIASAAKQTAPISVRVNPDVDPKTHPYISTGLRNNKFGVPMEEALALYKMASESDFLDVRGIDCHLGSQIMELEPYCEALNKILALVDKLESLDITLEHIDIGGGMAIRYQDESEPAIDELASAVRQQLGRREHRLLLEPGRSIVGNAGILLTRVITLKENGDINFAVLDAAMNDLIRPALYDAWQDVKSVTQHSGGKTFNLVGPICESGDFLANERQLELAEDDLVAIESAGAYGFVMSSNYNSRGRAAEVLVSGDAHYCIRSRETLDDLARGETGLPAGI